MKKAGIILVCALVVLAASTANAQVKKPVKDTKGKTTTKAKTKTKTEPANLDTIAFQDTAIANPVKVEPPHKNISDPLVVRYVVGGYTKDGKMYLYVNNDYNSLALDQKSTVISKMAKEFPGYDIMVCSGKQQRELWLNVDDNLRYVEQWDNDSLKLDEYLPLELNKSGRRKMFYCIGGSLSGGSGYGSGILNLRTGTYLLENFLDASVSLDLGYNKSNDQTHFVGDISIAARAYLPFRPKKVNIAPYAGAGISWFFAPTSSFELQMLAGGCWFVGIGSIDAGVQYGTQSGFSLTAGFSVRR